MTAYNSSNTNRLLKASSDQVRIMSEVVDFSSTTNAATDTFDVIGIPANTLVLSAGVDVLTAGTGTGTIAVGDSGDADQYVDEVAPTSTGQQTLLNAPEAYSSADDIRVTIATAAVNAKVRVWATMISLDKGGSDADTDSQNVTFS
jgi:hypothetical protein